VVYSWDVSWKRVGKMLLSIFLGGWLLIAAAAGVAYQLDPWLAARRMRKLEPTIDLIPTAVPDTRVANLSGQQVDAFGFSIQLPWEHLDQVRVRASFLTVSGGGGLVVFEDPSNPVSSVRTAIELAKYVPNISADTRHSICDLQQIAMEATTDQVKWWKTPRQNEKARELLLLKAVTEPLALGTEGKLYTMRSGVLCGFQKGDPQTSPFSTRIELADPAGKSYRFSFYSHNGQPAFTQAELNAIVASIRPVPQK
jgi:hypothetical protein